MAMPINFAQTENNAHHTVLRIKRFVILRGNSLLMTNLHIIECSDNTFLYHC